MIWKPVCDIDLVPGREYRLHTRRFPPYWTHVRFVGRLRSEPIVVTVEFVSERTPHQEKETRISQSVLVAPQYVWQELVE